MKKLSAYTVASNCTDLTDIRDGIAEIHEAMKTCVESGKHIPSFYVSRLAKLETKNLNSGYDLYASPVYYLQQNDIVYVEPNSMKARQATVNGNNVRSASFWMSLASLLTTITVLIVK